MSPRSKTRGPGRPVSRSATTEVLDLAEGDVEAEAVEGIEHPVAGARQLQPEFGVGVDGPAKLDDDVVVAVRRSDELAGDLGSERGVGIGRRRHERSLSHQEPTVE